MTTIADKVEHVLAAPNDGKHLCHWPGCQHRVSPARWGCKKHWFMLPLKIRTRIWTAYVPGQERTKRPSQAYIEAARAAQDWILDKMAKEQAARQARESQGDLAL